MGLQVVLGAASVRVILIPVAHFLAWAMTIDFVRFLSVFPGRCFYRNFLSDIPYKQSWVRPDRPLSFRHLQCVLLSKAEFGNHHWQGWHNLWQFLVVLRHDCLGLEKGLVVNLTC